MRLLFALLVLVGCTPKTAPPLPDTDAIVTGEVVTIDAEPMTYDGDGVVTVLTPDGTRDILIAARMNLCPAEGLGLLGELSPGTTVTARGTVVEDEGGAIRPCDSPDHYLRRE